MRECTAGDRWNCSLQQRVISRPTFRTALLFLPVVQAYTRIMAWLRVSPINGLPACNARFSIVSPLVNRPNKFERWIYIYTRDEEGIVVVRIFVIVNSILEINRILHFRAFYAATITILWNFQLYATVRNSKVSLSINFQNRSRRPIISHSVGNPISSALIKRSLERLARFKIPRGYERFVSRLAGKHVAPFVDFKCGKIALNEYLIGVLHCSPFSITLKIPVF